MKLSKVRKGNKMKTTPSLEQKRPTVSYQSLKMGDPFVYCGNLYIKCYSPSDDQVGVCLTDGEYVFDMCDYQVIKVKAEIKWSYNKTKTTKTKKEKENETVK